MLATDLLTVQFFPRIWDTYNISIVAWMRWKTVRRRRNKGLPSLLDRNELPDPVPADSTLYEALVLTSREQAKLARAQARFCRSQVRHRASCLLNSVAEATHWQTWYEPHHTPTHRPFSITWALWICVLNDGNSVFQWMLCGCMWGLDRFERPVWTTATLIPASFLCGVSAVRRPRNIADPPADWRRSDDLARWFTDQEAEGGDGRDVGAARGRRGAHCHLLSRRGSKLTIGACRRSCSGIAR